MALDRQERLVYVLDTVFGFASAEAAEVLEITPAAFRQRLARARARLDSFVGKTCGLASPDAACRCERQLSAVRHIRARETGPPPSLSAVHHVELTEAERQLDSLVRMGDAAAVFRAHPEYQAPESLRAVIRAVLRAEGYWKDDRSLQ